MKWLSKRSTWVITVLAIVIVAGVLRGTHTRFGFHCGLLPTANDSFLDGSGEAVQKCTWHLGNGRRTWGETYGVKIKRAYVTLQVMHRNPDVSESEARE
jgi:hypothetical protein